MIRTLAIEHDVPFNRVGNAWIFSDVAAERLKRLFEEHCRKSARAGVRVPTVGPKQLAALSG